MKIIKHPLFIAILVLVIANVALFWKFYFKGLLPFPGDLLVSYYFPWSSGGFLGFDSWTTRKDVIAMDVIRMMYPWKSLVIEQLKSMSWPFWNPYNFSGTPLLANIQSAIFFPTNLIFFLLPLLPAWILLVICLPLIFSFFWYLFFKSLRLSTWAAILGSICAANLTFLNVWTEQLGLLQSIFFLPLILWLITKFSETNKKIYILITPVLLAFSFFGGHPQTTLYVFILSGIYLIFRKIPLKLIFTVYLFAIAISCVQLLPTIELYRNSAREDSTLQKFITTTTLPWSNLATILAPDYYGNPATGNFRKSNYDNSIGYAGIVAITLAGIAVVNKKSKITYLFFLLTIFGLAFSLWPLALIFPLLHIPILSTGFLSRNIFFFELSVAILAALSLDSLIKSKQKILSPTVVIAFLYFILIAIALFFPASDRVVSLKNLIFPIFIFISCVGSIILLRTKFRTLAIILILCLAIFEYGYFFNKYQPFASSKFVFPDHPVFTFLQSTGFDRYFGADRAYIDNNFATYYRIYAPEGYDPLYIRRYGEMLSASVDGKFPKSVPAYDAYLSKVNNASGKKLYDILGIKYLIDKTDDPKNDFGPNDEKFPSSEYTFIKQVNKWKYYERKSVLPRVFLSGSYTIETNPQKTIETFYDPLFDPKTILLEKKPFPEPINSQINEAKIVEYTPNKVTIETNSDTPKLLFLSDNYYPGWIAIVDGKETPILVADYTFRAVALPAGSHKVIFLYNPLSFKIGLGISILALLGLILCLRLKR